MVTDGSGIHEDHPFRAPLQERDPVRRFRGRLPAPVSIVTAGDESKRAGLTVASVMVAEGEPALVYALIGPTTDLHDAMMASGGFVVHIGAAHHRELSDIFAEVRPQPGGPFAGMDVVYGDYGPELAGFENRLGARLVSSDEASYSALVVGAIEEITLGESDEPLVWYRGAYRSLR